MIVSRKNYFIGVRFEEITPMGWTKADVSGVGYFLLKILLGGPRPGSLKARVALAYQTKGLKLFFISFPLEFNFYPALKLPSLPAFMPASLQACRLPAGHFAIRDRSHMGRKIASAKKPTTAASPIVKIGPIASDNFFMEY